MLMGMASFHAAEAGHEYSPKVKAETLHQAPLPGVEGKEVIIKHVTIRPGHVGGRHYHLGPVFVYVLRGELTVATKRGTETYKTGQLRSHVFSYEREYEVACLRTPMMQFLRMSLHVIYL